MKKFYAWLQQLAIRKQILYAMMMITVLSSVLLGVVAYNVSRFVIERNYKEAYEYNLEVSSNILEIQLDIIIDSIRNALLDDAMMTTLKTAPSSYDGRIFNSEDHLLLSRTLVELAGLHDVIEGISVITVDGKARFYYKRVKSGAFEAYYKDVDLIEQSWVEPTRAAEGKEVFFGQDVLLGQSYPYFCFTKMLVEPFTGEVVGYMVVSLRDKIFDKAFGNGTGRYVSVSSMIVDRNGDRKVVYHNGDEEQKDIIAEGYLRGSETGSAYIYSASENHVTGWELVNAISKSDLNKDSTYIGTLILVTLCLLFFMSVVISRKVAGQIHRPLNQLETVIEEVGEGKRHIQEVFDGSEVGLIGQKFKAMVNNNLELRERLLNAQIHEREAELLLLQAQINPHFLYNTLDSLYCTAVIEENEKIAVMVESLANIFKLSLNKGKTIIRVSDEIEYIKAYMSIQNFRFNNRFDLQLAIDEEIFNGYMIKLILQPFVENAIQHGLEKKIGEGYVRVEGTLTEDRRIRFSIKDNGIGIDGKLADQGYGIRNVRERIRLCYGNAYGVSFITDLEEGTEVIVEIPYEPEPREGSYDSIKRV